MVGQLVELQGFSMAIMTRTQYLIDNVVQAYTQTPPDSTKDMVLDDEACIGYADIVDRTKCQFKIYTDIATEEEDTADFEEFLICGGYALTDDEGEILRDENGDILYIYEG